MIKQAYVTTALYALGKMLGPAKAITEFERQIRTVTDDALPAARTISRLADLIEIGITYDVGAAIVGQMRSRCFHRAYESGLPAWISVDDDIGAEPPLCAAMLEALDDDAPRIVLAPYVLRTTATSLPKLGVTLPLIRHSRQCRGAKLVTLPTGTGGGFGFVGMNRQAMDRVVLAHAGDDSLRWNDEDDGGEKLALFHDLLEQGMWWGEDTSFFRRVPKDVTVEALLTGKISHAGLILDLETL
jgi:hypothetical protein